VPNVTIAPVLATEAETAPSLKSELVTLAAQKAISLAIVLVSRLLKQLMPNIISPFFFFRNG